VQRTLLATIAVLVVTSASSPRAQGFGDWAFYGGDAGSTKYSRLDRIHAANVERLAIAWSQESPDNAIAAANPGTQPGVFQDTPLYVGGVLYTVSSLGVISALDPATGRSLWRYDSEAWRAGRPTNLGFTHRGLAYWTDGTAARLLLGTHDAYLISVDAKTGQPDRTFGADGRVDLIEYVPFAERVSNYAVNSTPVVVRDVVITGANISDVPVNMEAPRGDVSGYDVRTGRRLWTFRSVPRAGEFGHETWLDGSAEYTGNTNVWSLMSVDETLGYVYLPFGTPTSDYYGGHRPGDNLFAESLVCLDATSGKRVWHFQTVHHGIWDYDLPAAPILGDVTVNGRRTPIVAQISKQGFVYVFDRRTGEPVWPIEERPVPPSSVPGEVASPTQPFPARPAPFDLQGAGDDVVLDFTPALRTRALALLEPFERGPLFTPPTLKGTLQLPGNAGAATWNGAAFDPESGMLYVPSVTGAIVVQIGPADPARGNLRYRRQGGTQVPTLDGLPFTKPPYSRVTAYNLNTGETAWQMPLGNGPRDHPLLRDLNLPPLGSGGRGSPLLTRTLLFIAQRGARGEPAALVAMNKTDGRELRRIQLPLAPSVPMTYLHEGRQYLLVAVGGGADARLMAFALQE